MALSYPPEVFTASGVASTTYNGCRDLIWFMNGNGTQASSVVWRCIDCFDGTTREQPAGGDMTNLSGAAGDAAHAGRERL